MTDAWVIDSKLLIGIVAVFIGVILLFVLIARAALKKHKLLIEKPAMSKTKNNLQTFNCAKVYVGKYSYGYIADSPQYDTYESAKCGYKLLQGKVIEKHLRPINILGATGSDDEEYHHILKPLIIYPITHTAIIVVFNHKSKHVIRLVKYQPGLQNKMFKHELKNVRRPIMRNFKTI